MAGVEGNKNALGNSGGRGVNDRRKFAQLRGVVVDEALRLFAMDPRQMSQRELDLRDESFKRLLPTVLPRLNEVTGEDGAPLFEGLSPEDQAKLNVLLTGKPNGGTDTTGQDKTKLNNPSATTTNQATDKQGSDGSGGAGNSSGAKVSV